MNHDARYFEQLLANAKEGRRLPESDLRLVRSVLSSQALSADPYTLLHILGKANDRSAVAIIRRYLRFGIEDPADDGMVRRIAIQVLAQWWRLKDVFPILQGMAFDDPSPFVRALAASAMGELANVHPEFERDAAKALLRGIQAYGSEQRDVWGSFYVGMLELVGIDPQERPLRPGDLKPEDLDPVVVERVRRIAGTA